MLLVALILLIVVVLVVAALVGARWWVWRPLVHRRVLAQLDTGVTIAGIVLSRRGPLLVLGDVTVHLSGDQQTPADGRAIVERSRVVWMQVI